jgi:hypothetical protein
MIETDRADPPPAYQGNGPPVHDPKEAEESPEYVGEPSMEEWVQSNDIFGSQN